MSRFLHRQKIGTITYASGARATLEIPRPGVLLALRFRLRYTVSNDASGPAGPLFQSLARLMQRVEVIVGGRDTVVSISGAMLAVRNTLEFGAVADGMEDTVVLTDSVDTNYDVNLMLPFFLPRGRVPDDTALDLRRTRQATLAVTWGPIDCSDMFTTPDGSVIEAVTLDIEADYLVDMPNDRAYFVRQLDQIEDGISADSTEFTTQIDGQTGVAVRSLVMATTDAKVGSNAILNKVRLEAGSTVFQNSDGPAIRAENKMRFGQEALITGVYALSMLAFGELVDAINTRNLTADLNLISDVAVGSGATALLISREVIRPPKFVSQP